MRTRNRVVTCHTVKTQRLDRDKISNEDPGYLDRNKLRCLKEEASRLIIIFTVFIFLYVSIYLKSRILLNRTVGRQGGALGVYTPRQINKM